MTASTTNWEIIADGEGSKWVTLVAVKEGDQWSAICIEMDLATCADTPFEALDNLAELVRDYLAHGDLYQRVPDAALAEFLALHSGDGPTYGRSFGA